MRANPSLVILAAGLGSRYGGFKQMEPVGPNGEIIIDYSIFDALRAGFGKIIIVTNPELEAPMREHFAGIHGDRFRPLFTFQKLDDLPGGFQAAPERRKPWGTAHAIWSARALIDGPFGVINADDYYGPSSYRFLCQFLTAQAAPHETRNFCMVGFQLARTLSVHGTVSRGVCRADNGGHLIEIVEHTKIEPDGKGNGLSVTASGERRLLSGQTIVSMNMWGFDASLPAQLERLFRVFLDGFASDPKAEFFIPTAVDSLMKESFCRCMVLQSDEQWFGVTYREDRMAASAALGGRSLKG